MPVPMGQDAATLIEQGNAALQQADWPAAETLARAALRQGESIAARLALGRALIGAGRGRDGVGQLARAVELAPADVELRLLLAEALLAADRRDDGAVALARAWELAPDRMPLLVRLIDILHAAGRRDAAFRYLGQGLALHPRSAPLYARLARLLLDEGRPADATVACDRALAIDGGSIEALLARADLHDRAGTPEAAVRLLEQAQAARPEALELARALGERLLGGEPARALVLVEAALVHHPADIALSFLRAHALYRTGRNQEAVAAMAALAAAAPGNERIRYEFGLILRETGDLARAEVELRRAVAEHPAYLPPRLALSRLLAERGRLAEAVAFQARTIQQFPTAWEERASYGTNLLRLGEFRQGFAEHEHRLRTGLIEEPEGIDWYPLWQGERLDGRMLWLYPEQGFGDMIQFLRFVPRVAEITGARVVLGIFPPLARLCRDLPGVAQVVTDQFQAEPGTARCPLMSLGDRLAVTRDMLPGTIPYLTVPAAAREQWRTCLDDVKEFKVGLIWRGNPSHKRDAQRSMQLADLASLAAVPGVRFVSLDRDRPGDGPIPLYHPGFIEDFSDTAAIVEQLDLVIAVDTAVAHLAGALGKPVWILLDFEGDWRWSAEADRSPWYPTMRLYRQQRPGDWSGVVERVAATLRDALTNGLT
jgi:tetratricopeptide (TPR) repeat protein